MSDDGQQFYETVARGEEWESVITDPEYQRFLDQFDGVENERTEENRA